MDDRNTLIANSKMIDEVKSKLIREGRGCCIRERYTHYESEKLEGNGFFPLYNAPRHICPDRLL